MVFYLKIEKFRSSVPAGKGVIIYDADGMLDALRKGLEELEKRPNALLREVPSYQYEEIITIGPVVTLHLHIPPVEIIPPKH
jgi:hypothetical protein